MRSLGTGESWVARPLSPEKFRATCDPNFIVDWHSNINGVPVPNLRKTHGTREFRGSYNPRHEVINYTVPYTGVILHELAHHICHKQGLNGRGNWHDHNFGKILQELIDSGVY